MIRKKIILLGMVCAAVFAWAMFTDLVKTINGKDLPGQTGKVRGFSRLARENKDQSGYLTYGPYIRLLPGKYRLKVKYSASTDASGTLDWIFQGANAVIGQSALPAARHGWIKKELNISEADWREGKALEVRACYTGHGSLKLEKISFVREMTGRSILHALDGAIYWLLVVAVIFVLLDFNKQTILSAIRRLLTADYKKLWFSGISRENKTAYLTMFMTIGIFAAIIFHYALGMFYGKEFPLNTFLPGPGNRFCDFYSTFDQWVRLALTAPGLNYFPSAYLIIDFFAKISKNPYVAVIPYLGVFYLFFFIYAYQNLKSADKATSLLNAVIVFMAYPVLFTIHTGNMESFVFIFLALFIYFYQRENRVLGALFLGAAISMKLYPIVFLVLFISDKRYKEIIYVLLWVILLTLVPLLIFEGGVSSGLGNYLGKMALAQQSYKDIMIFNGQGNRYGHSLLNGIRVFWGNSAIDMTAIFKPYLVFALLAFSGLSAHVIFREKSFWKKVAVIVLALNLLPYTSTDYKLMHLFIPLFLFINCRDTERWDFLYILLFSLLLIPKDYCYFCGGAYDNLNIVINPLIMLIILLLIICRGIKREQYLNREIT